MMVSIVVTIGHRIPATELDQDFNKCGLRLHSTGCKPSKSLQLRRTKCCLFTTLAFSSRTVRVVLDVTWNGGQVMRRNGGRLPDIMEPFATQF